MAFVLYTPPMAQWRTAAVIDWTTVPPAPPTGVAAAAAAGVLSSATTTTTDEWRTLCEAGLPSDAPTALRMSQLVAVIIRTSCCGPQCPQPSFPDALDAT